jgi:hypothetical protein
MVGSFAPLSLEIPMRAASLGTLALALTTMAAACGSSSTGTGSGGSSGGGHVGSGGTSATGTGGSAGGSTGTGGSSATGTGGSSASGTGGTSSGAGGTSTGTGGSTAGTTGTGTGGASAAGSGGHAGAASGGTTGTAGTTGTGGTGTTSFCPAGAIFCANFEETSGPPTNNPVGTATFEDPSEYGSTFGGATGAMVLDKTDPYDGTQSLKVNPSSGFSVRTLAVAVPASFWVRLYIKSDMDIGQQNHNSFFGPGTDPDYSKGNYVELSEQYGCVLLNVHDTTYPAGTTCGANTALVKNVWHCMAAQFDGTDGNLQVFAGTTRIINATGLALVQEAFTTFSFGYFAYNPNSATVWYDDVVVSTAPLSCP